MSEAFKEIPAEAWHRAAQALTSLGVFADEERTFPGFPSIHNHLPAFERAARAHGYAGGALTIAAIEEGREGIEFLIFDTARYGDLSAAIAGWYQDYTKRWHEKVEDRVHEWLDRLNELRDRLGNWLPSGMSIVDRPPTAMHEELMRRFNVPRAEMPTFEVVKGNERIMRVQPKGLWVIGANGRVDIITKHGSYILVDEADPSAQHSNWRYYSPSDHQSTTPLDKDHFLSLLH